MNGKGDAPRPMHVSKKTFDDNWDRIFNRNKILDELTRIQEELGLYDIAPTGSEVDRGEHPRVDEDGSRIEHTAC
jgi:hypothetical protein